MTLPVSIRRNDAEPDLTRLSIVYDLHRISVVEGLRAACAVVAVVVLDQFVHWPPLLMSALAAMLACSADPGGTPRRRLPWMLGFAIAGGLIAAGFGMLREWPIWAVLPVACAGVFALGFMRVYGQSALVVGNLLTVVLVLALDRPETPHAALQTGAGFVLGGLWASALVMVLWPVRPGLPARQAVAAAYRALAELARDLRDLVGRGETDDAAWDAHARAHRRAVRTAIEAARAAMIDTVRRRGSITDRGPAALIRLEAGDQIFGALIALSDMLEGVRDPAIRRTAFRLLRVMRPFCVVLAHAAQHDATLDLARIGRGLAAMSASTDALPEELRGVARAIVERLTLAATLADPGDTRPGGGLRQPSWREALSSPVRANLHWRSPSMRHAARVAAAALPALAATLHWPSTYGHWLTITLVLTLQPFMSLIWQRALERIGGTLAGCVIAAGLSVFVTDGTSLVLAVVPMTLACFALRPAGYGLMMTFMTPLVVLLSELGRPGSSELEIATMRAACTLAGGALAVAAGMLLWPSREPARLRQAVRAALLAHAAYAEAELAELAGQKAAPVEPARRAAGRASNELETSLTRALLEPGRSAVRLEASMLADAALRRLAGRLAALQHGGKVDLPEPWRSWIVGALRSLAEGQHAGPRPAGDLPEALARLARQIGVMDGAIERVMA